MNLLKFSIKILFEYRNKPLDKKTIPFWKITVIRIWLFPKNFVPLHAI